MSKRRVVVTGLGVVSPFGVGIDKFWNSLVEGKSGISTIENIPLDGHTNARAPGDGLRPKVGGGAAPGTTTERDAGRYRADGQAPARDHPEREDLVEPPEPPLAENPIPKEGHQLVEPGGERHRERYFRYPRAIALLASGIRGKETGLRPVGTRALQATDLAGQAALHPFRRELRAIDAPDALLARVRRLATAQGGRDYPKA